MKIRCVFSIESPHRGDSNEYTQHTISNMKRKWPQIIPHVIMSASFMDFVLGTQERVRNSRGKQAIGVRATEVLLYI